MEGNLFVQEKLKMNLINAYENTLLERKRERS